MSNNVTLDSFLREISEKTTVNDQYPVLTSSKSGLYLQSDYFNKQVASMDNTGYKIIRRGQFTYRAMSDTGEFFPNMLECADVGIVSPAYPVFEITKPDMILPEYLKYFFKSDVFQYSIASFAQGSTRTSVKFVKLKTVSINLPSIDEQKTIVDLLDRAAKLIQLRREEMQELDDLIKARFVDMFGDPKVNEKHWDEGIIADYFEVKGGKRIPKGMDYAEGKTNHPYLRATDMKNETILDDDIHYIGEDVFQHIKRYIVQGGDIYLTNVGVNLGMAGVIPEKYSGANLTENAVKLVPKTDRFRGIFIANYINSPGIQEYIKERKMAVGVPKLAIFRIETMPLIIPPIEKQDEFAAFRAQVDKSKVAVQKALDEAQLLFDSLMQQYFG